MDKRSGGGWSSAWIWVVALIFPAAFVLQVSGQDGQDERAEQAGMGGVEERRLGKTSLTYLDGLVLGVVEGITEYLPISSTGHLILANRFLGLDVDEPLLDGDGKAIMVGEGEAAVPFTMKQAADGYTIIIQGGAILAVALLYTRRLWAAFVGGIGLVVRLGGLVVPPLRGYGGRFSESGMRLARNLLLAFLPAVALGLLLDEQIERYLFGPWPVVVALFLGGLLIFWVEAWRKARLGRQGGEDGQGAGGAAAVCGDVAWDEPVDDDNRRRLPGWPEPRARGGVQLPAGFHHPDGGERLSDLADGRGIIRGAGRRALIVWDPGRDGLCGAGGQVAGGLSGAARPWHLRLVSDPCGLADGGLIVVGVVMGRAKRISTNFQRNGAKVF